MDIYADEKARNIAAGGFIGCGRINGNLAISRAIGDSRLKRDKVRPAQHQIVTADPDVIIHERTDDDDFLVIASDGKKFTGKLAKHP